VTFLSTVGYSLTDFVNLKIKPVQPFRAAYRSRLCVHVFIGMNVHTCLSICIYIICHPKNSICVVLVCVPALLSCLPEKSPFCLTAYICCVAQTDEAVACCLNSNQSSTSVSKGAKQLKPIFRRGCRLRVLYLSVHQSFCDRFQSKTGRRAR
jgi:hypothetical protein